MYGELIVCCCPVLRNQAEKMRLEKHIGELETELLGLSRPSDRQRKQQQLHAKHRKLAQLEVVLFEAADSNAECASTDLSILVQLMGWFNLAVAACHGVRGCEATADLLLSCFPPLFAAEVLLQMRVSGVRSYFGCSSQPEQKAGR